MKVIELINILKSIPYSNAEIHISIDNKGSEFKEIEGVFKVGVEEDIKGNEIKGYIIYPTK